MGHSADIQNRWGERERTIQFCLTWGATTSNLGCNHQKLDIHTLDFCLGPCSASYDVDSSPLSPWDTLLTFKTGGGKEIEDLIFIIPWVQPV